MTFYVRTQGLLICGNGMIKGWKLRKTVYADIDDFEQTKSAGVWEGNKAK